MKKDTKLLETSLLYARKQIIDRLKENQWKMLNLGEIEYSKNTFKILDNDEQILKTSLEIITNFTELFKGNNYKIEKFDEFKMKMIRNMNQKMRNLKGKKCSIFQMLFENAFQNMKSIFK